MCSNQPSGKTETTDADASCVHTVGCHGRTYTIEKFLALIYEVMMPSGGRSAVPKIWNRCGWVAGQIWSQCSDVFVFVAAAAGAAPVCSAVTSLCFWRHIAFQVNITSRRRILASCRPDSLSWWSRTVVKTMIKTMIKPVVKPVVKLMVKAISINTAYTSRVIVRHDLLAFRYQSSV